MAGTDGLYFRPRTLQLHCWFPTACVASSFDEKLLLDTQFGQQLEILVGDLVRNILGCVPLANVKHINGFERYR